MKELNNKSEKKDEAIICLNMIIKQYEPLIDMNWEERLLFKVNISDLYYKLFYIEILLKDFNLNLRLREILTSLYPKAIKYVKDNCKKFNIENYPPQNLEKYIYEPYFKEKINIYNFIEDIKYIRNLIKQIDCLGGDEIGNK